MAKRRVSRVDAGKVIEIVEITGAERDRLLTLDESHFCDLKAADISPAKLTRTISAFANAAGGDLYIGIAEQEMRSAPTGFIFELVGEGQRVARQNQLIALYQTPCNQMIG